MYLLKFGVDLTSELTAIKVDSNKLSGGEFVDILHLKKGKGTCKKKGLQNLSKYLSKQYMSKRLS